MFGNVGGFINNRFNVLDLRGPSSGIILLLFRYRYRPRCVLLSDSLQELAKYEKLKIRLSLKITSVMPTTGLFNIPLLQVRSLIRARPGDKNYRGLAKAWGLKWFRR